MHRRQSAVPSFGLALATTSALLSGCIGLGAGSPIPVVTSVDGAPSPTAFQPVPVSPTPSTLILWVSPWLPPELDQLARGLSTAAGMSISFTDDSTAADVRLEPSPQQSLSTWIYALAAPFPTVEDAATLDELRSVWTGQGGAVAEILVTEETEQVMIPILGDPSPASVKVGGDHELSERAWRDRSAWAILPFGALDPTWKVLAVDGRSPVEQDFDAEAYPLRVPFGVSGAPAGADALQAALAWPASNRDASRLTIVLMTGVTAITRGVAWRMDDSGVAFPAEEIGDWLRSADFTHVSQEIAFSPDCPPPDPYQPTLRFCGDPDHFRLLQISGVDLVELTGNHILDFGAQAFLDTLALYRGAGMATFAGGANLAEARTPVLIDHNGNHLAFLGCNAAGPNFALATASRPGGMPCDYTDLEVTLAGLRREGYLPIFTFQWFEAYRDSPLPNQVQAFRRMIDAGAVIVSGSQAHQPQGYEVYAGGWIHYGLGNLFFDQMWSTPTRQELLDRYVFYEGRHLSTQVLTAYLEDFAQPRPMTQDERADFLRKIFAASGW
ncbi:MAG: CapA family protein [Anaerolineales bacterium]